MYKLSKGSISYSVSYPEYGQQDLGVSAKGASDMLSFEIAHILLNRAESFQCEEIIYANYIEIQRECMFCLTGAPYKDLLLNGVNPISQKKVYKAKKGERIVFKTKLKGFRSYFMCADIDTKRIGLEINNFTHYFKPYLDKVRVIKGVEFDYLKNNAQFFQNYFQISHNSNRMGIKLEGEKIEASSYDIISSPVSDGTIQLTKDGPIVLMRHRQTTGGYPRVLQVISTDINLLAQYKPTNLLMFELISLDEAKKILLEEKDALKLIETKINQLSR